MLGVSKLIRIRKLFSLSRPAKYLAGLHRGSRCSSQDANAGVPYKTLQVFNSLANILICFIVNV